MSVKMEDDDGPRYGQGFNLEENLPTADLPRDTLEDIARLRELAEDAE